ncbi:unnamed protein product [Microthlaspi erraticum]|uniref:F-box associated beta-propeller type 1 domain-containing protein n=1 Tax=Microthlaspi erraticum TaxID=1685480 RepID=A0A6D2JB55_9BRAS|nr:unnamed protein product [Microthlaspi erraticum]
MADFESALAEVKGILSEINSSYNSSWDRLTKAIAEITGRLDTMDRRFESMESNMNRMTEILARIEANQLSGKASERRVTMELFRDLPKELVEEEILTRVPAKYLKGLGTTCKRWNRLFTGDRRFARNHSDKAAKQFLGLMSTRAFRICPIIVDRDGKVPTFEVNTELSLVDPHSKYPGAQFNVGAIFHCDGLLLCTSVDESRFVVWNPFTGETRWFQPSYRRPSGRRFALGYGQNQSYKILSYYDEKDIEIYEFSSDSWRVVDDVMPRGCRLNYSDPSVSLKGSTYLFGYDRDETRTQSSVSLVKFDFSTEKCVLVPLPYQCNRFEAACVSVVKEERLSVLLQLEDTSKTEIWVSNKIDETTTQVVSWSKVLSLDLSPDLQLSEQGTFLLDEEKKAVVISINWIDFGDEVAAGTRSKEMIYIVGEDSEVTQVDFGMERTPPCHTHTLPLGRLIASGIVSYDGDKGVKHRRIINPAFHLDKIKIMGPAFNQSCSEVVGEWDKLVSGHKGSSSSSCEVDVWPWLVSMTGDVISPTAFGSSYKEGQRIFELQAELAKLIIQAFRKAFIPGYKTFRD